MTHRALGTRALPLLTVVALLAGCGGDGGTAPVQAYDPRATLDQLDAVLEPLDVGDAVFDGLWLATESLYAYGAAPVADLLRSTGSSLLQASVPEASALKAVADHHLRRLQGGSDAGMARLTFPSTIQGRTLVWDAGQDAYVVDSGLVGAPADGVRIIYYATDSSGYPRSPLTPLGYIDLTDDDRSLAERVGVRVVEYGASAAQDRERADYNVEMSATGSNSEGTLDIAARGSVNDGFDAVTFDLLQRFTWSDYQDFDRLEMDYQFEVDEGPVSLAVVAESPFDASYWETVSFDVLFGDGSGQVEMAVDIDASGRLTGSIQRSGRTVIEVSGTDGDPVFRRVGGAALTAVETSALEQIWIGVSELIVLTEWLIVPGNLLVLPG